MKLFDLFQKKQVTICEESELKSGVIEKEPSFLMAVSANPESLKDIDRLINQINDADDLKVVARKLGEEPAVVVSYKEKEYLVEFSFEIFDRPEIFRVMHDLNDEEQEVIRNADKGLLAKMTFTEDNMDSFHTQIKVINAMVPDLVGVLDFSAEKIISARWVRLAATSRVAPAPSYLYTVQAVSDKSEVWLHTHGLNRAGSVELEIIDSNKTVYGDQYHALSAFAERIITTGEAVNEEEPLYIGMLSNNQEVMATWIDYRRVLSAYRKNILGGVKDRQDAHNENTGIMYIYQSEEDYKNRKFSPISIYNRQLQDNPIFMKTTKETKRMSELAMERIPFLQRLYKDGTCKQILIKVGLKVDPEYDNGDNNREHIWFEVKSMTETSICGILTQQPYYVSTIKEGDERNIEDHEITDWIAFREEDTITPDSVYRLS
ncbi:MAG: DUF4026 domain-containing protein [bacterium]|nr:DUF4026 domain-containing protein [bacterium]